MIEIETVIKAHNRLIDTFGGSKGIREESGLLSAIARPFQDIFGQAVHPTPVHQAAAVLESLCINYPFIDGNKRIAYLMAEFILRKNGLAVNATEDEKYDLTIAVASGQLNYNAILEWLQQHVRRV